VIHAEREYAARLETSRHDPPMSTLAKLADPDLYQRLDSLTRRGDALFTKVERGEGTVGKLIKEDELYARMDKLLTDMEDLVADLKDNPTKYFSFSVF